MSITSISWHTIHSRVKTETDFWRLNVDGVFWALQAAREAGVRRLVFLSSMSWHGHYDKYGFTKRIGEELCEYHRRNHGLRYVAVRPGDFTPWGDDYVNGYGARLLYGGVDRDDVLDCVERAVEHLATALPPAAGVSRLTGADRTIRHRHPAPADAGRGSRRGRDRLRAPPAFRHLPRPPQGPGLTRRAGRACDALPVLIRQTGRAEGPGHPHSTSTAPI